MSTFSVPASLSVGEFLSFKTGFAVRRPFWAFFLPLSSPGESCCCFLALLPVVVLVSKGLVTPGEMFSASRRVFGGVLAKVLFGVKQFAW